MQPGFEHSQSFRSAYGEYLNAAVGKVDGMPGEVELLGLPARTLTKPDALDTAVNREQPRFGIHRINSWARTTRWP